MSDNYIMGAGKLFFAPFAPGTDTPTGRRYIGNTPGFTIGNTTEKTDHYSSDSSVKEKDLSITTSIERNATIKTDEISPENLALAFLGAASTVTNTESTVTDEPVSAVEQGLYYQLGRASTRPAGHRGLIEHTTGVDIVVKDDDVTPTTFDAVDDYTVDMATGQIYIVPGGAIVDGTNLEISYKVGAGSYSQVISGNDQVRGELYYVADNQGGANRDVLLPKTLLSPNGEIDLKSSSFTEIDFSVEIQKKAGYEAVYINGRKA